MLSKFILLALSFLVESRGSVNSSPLVDGVEFRKDLRTGEVACKSISIPSGSNRINIKASVVGLTGNPNLFGGWDQRELISRLSTDLAPPNSGGYHILSEYHDVPHDRNDFHLCVTSFSTQGSDYLMTASVSDAGSWYVPPVRLLDAYPTVWRIDAGGRDYTDFILPIQEGASEISVSVTPFSGEVDVQLWDCDSFSETLASSALTGPDVISVSIPPGMSRMCIRAHSSSASGSEFSIVAWTDPQGPFLAQSISIASPNTVGSKFRAYFNRDTDLSILTQPEGLGFVADTEPSPSAWPSDSHGKLDLSRSALSKLADAEILYISVTHNISASNTPIIFSLTSHGTVEQLEDGMPLHVSIDGSGESRFRDFRLWIPKGTESVVIQGDSSADGSGLGIFAGTVRTSHDPRGYAWNTMTGTNEIILSRGESKIENSDYLPCDQCYVYISVKSCVVQNGVCKETGSSQFVITALTDKAVLHLSESVSQRTIVSGADNKFTFASIVVADIKDEGIDVMLTPLGGSTGVRASINTERSFLEETAVNCDRAGEICRLVIPKDDAMRNSSHLFVIMHASADAENIPVDIAFRTENNALALKNHHRVVSWITSGRTDKYKLFIPKTKGVDAMIDISSLEGTVEFTVCQEADCQTVSGSATIHLKNKGLTSIAVKSENDGKYRIIPSFFSLSGANALRLDYVPVNLKIAPASKSSWEIGYSETAEWLVNAKSSSSVDMCIAEEKVRCCTVPCTLQGFGREQIWLENKDSASTVIVTLSTESLSVLESGKPVNVRDRKNEFFKVPVWPSRIELPNGGEVGYMIGSLDSVLLASPPADGDVGKTQSVFAKISNAESAVLVPREELFLNTWHDGAKWSKYVSKIPGLIIRVERCDPGEISKDLTANRITVGGAFLDIPTNVGESEVFVSGEADFRIGLLSSAPVAINIVRAIEGAEPAGYLTFIAPNNAAGSLYRTMCMNSKIEPSQCVMERSPFSLHGTGTACEPNSECALLLPEGCSGEAYVSVVADRGPEFGLFEPVALSSGLTVSNSGNNGSSGYWLWLVVKLAVAWCAIRWAIDNKMQIRIWAFRAIDYFRFSKNVSGKKILMEEMMETGGRYQRFSEPVRSVGRPMEMVHHRGGYYGA